MPLATRLAPNVWRIPTIGRAAVNSFALAADDGSVTLVDTGIKKAPPRIVAALAEIGKQPRDVTRIVLTHAHPDHAGGAAELARETGAQVAIHSADVGFATAGKPPRSDASLLSARIFNRLNRNASFPAFEVGEPLSDGDVLDAAGGLRVVHTPGHSPGHVSLVHEPTSVLITGDALFHVGGLRWPMRFLCADFRLTQQTAHVLGELEYEVAAFTHGPEITENARELVRGFLRRLGAHEKGN